MARRIEVEIACDGGVGVRPCGATPVRADDLEAAQDAAKSAGWAFTCLGADALYLCPEWHGNR